MRAAVDACGGINDNIAGARRSRIDSDGDEGAHGNDTDGACAVAGEGQGDVAEDVGEKSERKKIGQRVMGLAKARTGRLKGLRAGVRKSLKREYNNREGRVSV